MVARYVLDPKLQDYCTEKQWSYLLEWSVSGTAAKAARVLGVSARNLSLAKAAVLKKAARQGYAPEFGLTHQIPAGMTSKGVSSRYGRDGEIDQQWVKTTREGRAEEEVFQLPDPKLVTKTSRMLDAEGRVIVQWIAEKPEDVAKEKLWREFATALAADMPRAEPITGPKNGDEDMMACYPVGDHHLGMLAWDKETGADYDLKIGERILSDAVEYLIATAPECKRAAVVFLGDFMHYDSFEPVTPTSRNMLDSDGRFPKMVRVAIRAMRHMIEAAAKHHGSVKVIIEIGNHDLSSSIFLMECLHNIYENSPNIEIDTSPQHYHYFEFGKNLVGTHHGHGAKAKDLPLIMANDQPEAWGRTEHRYIWTGHIHHDSAIDVGGCRVESFRVLAPVDAWAHQKGYRSARDMKSIVLHKDFGEVERRTVSARMFQ